MEAGPGGKDSWRSTKFLAGAFPSAEYEGTTDERQSDGAGLGQWLYDERAVGLAPPHGDGADVPAYGDHVARSAARVVLRPHGTESFLVVDPFRVEKSDGEQIQPWNELTGFGYRVLQNSWVEE